MGNKCVVSNLFYATIYLSFIWYYAKQLSLNHQRFVFWACQYQVSYSLDTTVGHPDLQFQDDYVSYSLYDSLSKTPPPRDKSWGMKEKIVRAPHGGTDTACKRSATQSRISPSCLYCISALLLFRSCNSSSRAFSCTSVNWVRSMENGPTPNQGHAFDRATVGNDHWCRRLRLGGATHSIRLVLQSQEGQGRMKTSFAVSVLRISSVCPWTIGSRLLTES